jgi:hypothetical protein
MAINSKYRTVSIFDLHLELSLDLSCPKIITNVFVQAIILLYLIDNNENTSWMILLGSGMGVVIEAWKVWLLSFDYIALFLLMHFPSDYKGRRY